MRTVVVFLEVGPVLFLVLAIRHFTRDEGNKLRNLIAKNVVHFFSLQAQSHDNKSVRNRRSQNYKHSVLDHFTSTNSFPLFVSGDSIEHETSLVRVTLYHSTDQVTQNQPIKVKLD